MVELNVGTIGLLLTLQLQPLSFMIKGHISVVDEFEFVQALRVRAGKDPVDEPVTTKPGVTFPDEMQTPDDRFHGTA
jgi:hypothetical protein